MKNITLEKSHYFYNDLISKAWESEVFKEELINNPKATIERVVGTKMSIPEESKIVVEDQTDPNIIYFNIPKNIKMEDLELELTDEQLEAISGGLGFWVGLGLGITIVVGVSQIAEWLGDGWNAYP
jgi:hypothetical protein